VKRQVKGVEHTALFRYPFIGTARMKEGSLWLNS
jgi:hypothetical protein